MADFNSNTYSPVRIIHSNLSEKKHIPRMAQGHQRLMPYLIVRRAAGMIDFLKAVFEDVEVIRLSGSGERIEHAEVQIGEATILLADATRDWPPLSASLYMYVADTDATYQRALTAGATSLMIPADEEGQARGAGIRDPFGNTWWLATLGVAE